MEDWFYEVPILHFQSFIFNPPFSILQKYAVCTKTNRNDVTVPQNALRKNPHASIQSLEDFPREVISNTLNFGVR